MRRKRKSEERKRKVSSSFLRFSSSFALIPRSVTLICGLAKCFRSRYFAAEDKYEINYSLFSLFILFIFIANKSWFPLTLHYISSSNLRLLLLLLSLQLRDLCPYATIQGLIRPSPPRSRCDQSDRDFLNTVRPRANS